MDGESATQQLLAAPDAEAATALPLIKAVHPDDLSAYYEKYSINFYRLALSIVGCPDTANDMVQDAFAVTASRLAEGLAIENLSGWLYRVVQNKCRMHLRAPSGRSPVERRATRRRPAARGPRRLARSDRRGARGD